MSEKTAAAENEYLALWPDSKAVACAVELCNAFSDRDWDRVRACVGDDLHFSVGGSNALAGMYEGPDAFVALLRRMVEMTDGTYRLSNGRDSYDILLSPYHIAILAPFVGERSGRVLEQSIQIWQFHAGDRLESYSGLYLADQTVFDAFWG